MKPTGTQTGFRILSEVFIVGTVLCAIILGVIGLLQGLPGAVFCTFALGLFSLIIADLSWSLDILRTLETAESEGKDTKEILDEQGKSETWQRPIMLLAWSFLIVLLTAWALLVSIEPNPDKTVWSYSTMALVMLLGVVLWFLSPRIIVTTGPEIDENKSRIISTWGKFTAVVLWLILPSFIGITVSDPESPVALLTWFSKIAGVLVIIASLEVLIKSFAALLLRRSQTLDPAPLPLTFGSFISDFSAIKKAGAGDRVTPVQPAAWTWLGDFFKNSLPRVVIGIGLIVWLSTSLTQIGISEQGVRERFGKNTGEVLEPGLHLGFPWPIDRVMRFPSLYNQVFSVGFEADTDLSRMDLIWAEPHGIEQFLFLTASGREVVSVDIEVTWRIKDVLEYAYTCQNQEELLRSLSYRAVMLRTNSTNSDNLLTRDRSELATSVKTDIQAVVDNEKLGIEIAQVSIIAIHPPYEVASAYQAVVSAQVLHDTLAIQASTYRDELIPSARADAQTVLDEAEGYDATRVANARGEAAGFVKLLDPYNRAPFIYRFRERLEVLEQGLPGQRLYIVNTDFIDSEGADDDRGLWFDLR
jgi:membrane protease subunit HflK